MSAQHRSNVDQPGPNAVKTISVALAFASIAPVGRAARTTALATASVIRRRGPVRVIPDSWGAPATPRPRAYRQDRSVLTPIGARSSAVAVRMVRTPSTTQRIITVPAVDAGPRRSRPAAHQGVGGSVGPHPGRADAGRDYMDPKRFDNWTRNHAWRLSRRDALRLAGAGGAGAALPSITPSVLAEAPCRLDIRAQTAGGPSASASYDGTLAFTLGSDGSFAQAVFTPTGDADLAASGHATGRAIDFQISLTAKQTLAFVGAGDQPISTCSGAIGGLLIGPEPGDLGAWQATPVGSSGPAAPVPSAAPGSSSTCPPPQILCGSTCCPGGAVCSDTATGSCACPDGTVPCGLNCVSRCPEGTALDPGTCSCGADNQTEPSCIAESGACTNHGQCCTGYCAGGTCLRCSGIVCGDFGCVDPSRDSQNCGGCGVLCVAPNGSCNGGVCGCSPDGFVCANHLDCCSSLCPPSGICGCAGTGVACTSTGDCCDQLNDICESGRCGHGAGACGSDDECITGICTNGGCVSCTNPGGTCTRSKECCNDNGLGCVNGLCPP